MGRNFAETTIRSYVHGIFWPPSQESLSFTDDALAAEHLRTYVRQLQLIEGSDEDVFEAINQFLRAAAERSAWSKQGLVHDKSFDEYEEALISVWKNKRSVHDIIHKDLSDVDRGKLLLADSVSTSKSSRGWNRRFFLLRAASMPRLRTRLSAGTPNTKSFSAPERTMAILNREVRAIQNPALGAVLTWRAASSYPPGRYLRNSTPRIRSGSSKMRSCWTI